KGATLYKGMVLDALQNQLDRQDALPLNRQAYRVIRQLILARVLPGGARLPASRLLASELGLSRNTILQAYETLQAEGFVTSAQGSGTYVARTIAPMGAAPARVAQSEEDEVAL